MEDDGICDTESITISPLIKEGDTYRVPTNQDINPCSGNYYQGTQYNIMGYGPMVVKFTPGQRDLALYKFLNHRKNLTQSRMGEILTNNNQVVLNSAKCLPKERWITNSFDVGISQVVFGQIDNITSTNEGFYIDYVLKNQSVYRNVFTDISENSSEILTIKGGKIDHNVNVWIDYNNDGYFGDNEKVASEKIFRGNNTFSVSVTPPDSAVRDVYLRMRVMADDMTNEACGEYFSGQVEDYAVRIVSGERTSTKIGINAPNPTSTLDIGEVKPTSTPQVFCSRDSPQIKEILLKL